MHLCPVDLCVLFGCKSVPTGTDVCMYLYTCACVYWSACKYGRVPMSARSAQRLETRFSSSDHYDTLVAKSGWDNVPILELR